MRTVESTVVAAPNPLLPKARSLARNHAVTLTVEGGRIDAAVVTSGRPHRVRIDVPRWSAREQADAERLIAEALADHRGLAPGDLPDTLEADLRHHDVGIAPALADLDAGCECRTRQRPCVHVLTTLYALSQQLDERPVLAVELRSSGAKPATPPDPDRIEITAIDVAGFYGD
ncbi:hypothetical protein [Embleya sp. NPDC050493]|uniref:hypothetical protein n=1 Tax=Embleya sp. NPDC050493 TaxID=3363989 RepID=UPI00379B87EB